MEIRSFMPRYGVVNERRNQLHEVIRLSGMNIVINEFDRPLIIKVASISAARMQIYFIDNEDYFHRKAVFEDAQGKFFEDNDERAVFFAKGVLETVKKLRWKPDIVHCQGWISHVLPAYLKSIYKDDPIFSDCRTVVSLYNEHLDAAFSEKFADKLASDGISADDAALLNPATGINLAKFAVRFSDAVIMGSPELPADLTDYVSERGVSVLPYIPTEGEDRKYIAEYGKFYDQITR